MAAVLVGWALRPSWEAVAAGAATVVAYVVVTTLLQVHYYTRAPSTAPAYAGPCRIAPPSHTDTDTDTH
jgi:hypothetical protein